MEKLARLMERNGIESLRQTTMQEQENRIAELEAQNQMLTQCLMEMSQIVYA